MNFDWLILFMEIQKLISLGSISLNKDFWGKKTCFSLSFYFFLYFLKWLILLKEA